jgi:hypothetical protein
MEVAGIVADLLKAFSSYLREDKIVRRRLIWTCLFIIVLAMIGLAFLVIHPFNINGTVADFNNLGPFLLIPGFFAFFVLVIAGTSFLDPDRLDETTREAKEAISILGITASLASDVAASFAQERPRRTGSTAKAGEKPKEKADILDAINLNLAQVVEYYVINKGQAKRSFQMSVSAIIVGFLTIIAGIWLSYGNQLTNQNPAYISVLAGVVLQFIGGAYFYLYNRSLIQLNFFFSRLALMQDTMLAIRLCDSIPEGRDKHHVLERLIFQIVTRDSRVPQYLKEAKAEPVREEKSEPKPRPTRTKRAANAG